MTAPLTLDELANLDPNDCGHSNADDCYGQCPFYDEENTYICSDCGESVSGDWEDHRPDCKWESPDPPINVLLVWDEEANE